MQPNILTDKKHVRWEYALEIATEYGYESGDALKEAIEEMGEAKQKTTGWLGDRAPNGQNLAM